MQWVNIEQIDDLSELLDTLLACSLLGGVNKVLHKVNFRAWEGG